MPPQGHILHPFGLDAAESGFTTLLRWLGIKWRAGKGPSILWRPMSPRAHSAWTVVKVPVRRRIVVNGEVWAELMGLPGLDGGRHIVYVVR